jgi:translation initiation factor 2 alpha subunit (eIF-2alpha)
MGHVKKKKKNKVTYSDSNSEFKPSYEELQQAIKEMHGEALNAFERLIAQKKTILKLEKEFSQIKNDFKCLKEEQPKRFFQPHCYSQILEELVESQHYS